MSRRRATGHFVLLLAGFVPFVFGHLVTAQRSPADVVPIEPVATEAVELDQDLLSTLETMLTENNCALPCWWGLQPGRSTINDVATLLQNTGLDRDQRGYDEFYDNAFTLEELIAAGEPFGLDLHSSFEPTLILNSFQVSFGFNKTLLRTIRVHFIIPGEWLSVEKDVVSLPKIAENVPELPTVLILRPENPPFTEVTVFLIYPERGTLLSYEFTVPNSGNISSGLCVGLKDTQRIEFSLYEPTDTYFLEQVENIAEDNDVETPLELWDVETEDFIETILESPQGCFEPTHNEASS